MTKPVAAATTALAIVASLASAPSPARADSPPSAPTIPKMHPATLPSQGFGRCGDPRIAVRIVGRVPRPMAANEVGYASIEAHDPTAAAGTVTPAQLDAALHSGGAAYMTLVKRMFAQQQAESAHRAVPSPARQVSPNEVVAKLGKGARTMLDKLGVFHCDGLPSGLYDVTITVQHAEAATGQAATFSTQAIAMERYSARLFVPRPVKGRIALVSPAEYTKTLEYDPNHQ